MSNWSDFEIQCKEYLERNFMEYATFELEGGSDSTTPDIKVTTNLGKTFYIEVKLCPAQCGQFVLLPNDETKSFVYSEKNNTQVNIYSKKIMEHMNKSFYDFKEAGTKGKEIVFDNNTTIFSNWIINYYKNQGVNYFITNNYIIVPIENIIECFNITAVYRIKRSGSTDVGTKNRPDVQRHIDNLNYNITITNSNGKNPKLFVESNEPIHNKRFRLLSYEYMFSRRNSVYEVRKLSNTYNANVIFSINIKNDNCGLNSDEFIKKLK